MEAAACFVGVRSVPRKDCTPAMNQGTTCQADKGSTRSSLRGRMIPRSRICIRYLVHRMIQTKRVSMTSDYYPTVVCPRDKLHTFE